MRKIKKERKEKKKKLETFVAMNDKETKQHETSGFFFSLSFHSCFNSWNNKQT